MSSIWHGKPGRTSSAERTPVPFSSRHRGQGTDSIPPL